MTGTPVDSLFVGNWIAVVESDSARKLYEDMGRCDYAGHPLKIKGINLPFLCCDFYGKIVVVDVRSTTVQRLTNKKYISLMLENNVPGRKSFIQKKKKKKKEKLEEGHCVRCGCRLRKRMTVEKGWVDYCPDCGWEGDPVPIIT